MTLSIADRHIKGAPLGEAAVGAQLEYGAVALTDEKSQQMKLPGRHVFAAPGLKIPPL